MLSFTIWYGIRFVVDSKERLSEITEYLAMNGYTFDTNGEDTLFVYGEEIEYVLAILDDNGINYEEL